MKERNKAANILHEFTIKYEALVRVNFKTKQIILLENYGEVRYLPFYYKGYKIDIC